MGHEDDEPRPNENSNSKNSKLKKLTGASLNKPGLSRGGDGEEYHLGSPSHAQQQRYQHSSSPSGQKYV